MAAAAEALAIAANASSQIDAFVEKAKEEFVSSAKKHYGLDNDHDDSDGSGSGSGSGVADPSKALQISDLHTDPFSARKPQKGKGTSPSPRSSAKSRFGTGTNRAQSPTPLVSAFAKSNNTSNHQPTAATNGGWWWRGGGNAPASTGLGSGLGGDPNAMSNASAAGNAGSRPGMGVGVGGPTNNAKTGPKLSGGGWWSRGGDARNDMSAGTWQHWCCQH